MNRVLLRVIVLAASLSGAVSIGGCKSEPPPPEEPNFESLRERFESTKQDMAEAHRKMKEAADKARADRLAKHAAAEGDSSKPDAGAAPAQ